MNGHGSASSRECQRGMDDNRKVIGGRLPAGPFETTIPVVASSDSPYQKLLKRAMIRDRAYSSAGPVYMRVFGLHQGFRELSEIGKAAK